MKKITEEQITMIINGIFEINAPVKFYKAIKEMLETLPEIEDEKK